MRLFSSLCAERHSDDELKSLAVDRADTLNELELSVLCNSNSVLLYGERGVGKTFVSRMFSSASLEKYDDAFTSYVDLGHIYAFINMSGVGVAQFPIVVLYQLCTNIWKRLVGKDFVSLKMKAKKVMSNGKVNTVEDYISFVFGSILSVHNDLVKVAKEYNLGLSSLVSGGVRRSVSVEAEVGRLHVCDFIEYTDILVSKVLPVFSMSRIVVVCDEANKLPVEWQERVLGSYFDVFKSKSVSFVFVSSEYLDGIAAERFDKYIKIRGLEFEHVKEMINIRTRGSNVVVPDNVVKFLCNEYNGNPIKILGVLSVCECCGGLINIENARKQVDISREREAEFKKEFGGDML